MATGGYAIETAEAYSDEWYFLLPFHCIDPREYFSSRTPQILLG